MKYLLPLLLFVSLPVQGQDWYLKRTISWNHPEVTAEGMDLPSITSFTLSDYANYDALLPRYFENISWHRENTSVKISFFRAEYQTVYPDSAAAAAFEELTDSIITESHISLQAGKPFLQIAFKPFRKNPVTGLTERLTSFVLKIESNPVEKSGRQAPKKSMVTGNSILATGNWFKIKIPETGIYKLTFDQLREIGLSDPANVRVYGWGGVCLPGNSQLGDQNDLLQSQVYMNKGGDGIFNAGDFILFYARGPVTWQYDQDKHMFQHDRNPYSDYGFYFLTSDKGSCSPPVDIPGTVSPPTRTTNSYDYRIYHENDEYNVLKLGTDHGSGREWYGEDFGSVTRRNFTFTIPGLISDEPVSVLSQMIGRAKDTTRFIISADNRVLDTVAIRPTNLTDYAATYAFPGTSRLNFMPGGGEDVNIGLRYEKDDNESEGFLDYICLNARARLEMRSSLLMFRDSRGISSGSVTHFTLTNAGASTQVWDVTDPHNIGKIKTSLDGSVLTFTAETENLREFVAFDPSASFPSPVWQGEGTGKIPNQNIHGAGHPQYIVVTHPDFVEYARELADYRTEHDGLSCLVVTTPEIYNEFSSGRPDVTAIRNMMRYFYKNAGDDISKMPRYLLLFGDGSFDNKSTAADNRNFVPTYQSENSISPTASYVSDDYFALLDDGEDMYYGLLDIGVGRLPVNNAEEARAMVDKIIGYEKPERMGEWRNSLCFIGDDEDYNTHFNQANELAQYVEGRYPYFNVNKIFLDAYKQISTPVGQRYPDVNKAIKDQVARGALIINYTGHGGTKGLAHERILETEDIGMFSNKKKLPLFMTATCEFSRFDEPDITSAGEEVILNPGGGGIALLTTTRLVYSGPNHVLNEHFYEIVFEKDASGANYSLGDILKYTKNKTGFGINKRNFTLLGDPAMKLTYPFYHVVTDSMDHREAQESSDTLSALREVSVSGHIEDLHGNPLTSFNGVIQPVVYDKPTMQTTLGNDGGPTKTFYIRNSIIYKGKASVSNGRFSFDFFVPRDISYAIGGGKLSYYASDSVIDAAGAFLNFQVGGSSQEAESDLDGPDIDLFMNDAYFKPGGITGENPVLFAKIFDEHGINTTGNGIGHDITGILDGDSQNPLVLNEYYQADLNSYQSGTLNYPLFNLAEGNHELQVKVWDTYNNSSQASINFVVVSSKGMILENLMNFPNPFSESTSISFEHNNSGADLDITIDIFNMAGKLVKTIKTKEYNSGFRSQPIEWNGFDESGDKSRQGIYIYRIHVISSDGKEATRSGKLIIVR